MAKPHVHADLMIKAAEIAQTDAEWWKHFQAKSDNKIGWRNLGGEIAFIEGTGFEYRLKPQTCRNTRQSADSTDSK
ncbi:hypothetical protein [Xenorhabdus bovienii]|uniref:hypothetical protein n=1 Tax=Xenorhabdus bovienii TaxID=40576 RepID=UPI0023B3531B|nr:hypothetical protein [Xenorhabdus bovienii]MDE9484367.1 hypothetical protein [Xenorhabdus bovienii]